MKSVLSSISLLLVLLLLSLSSAAPVEKAPETNKNVNEVQEQEEELRSLLHLADEKSARNDVTVHEEHTQHVHTVNGQKMEVDTARKTVSDTKTGQVLSDVKQEVSKADDSAGPAQPEVEVKTEVDVPAEGVHETVVQSGNEEEMEGATEPEVEEAEEEFSPEAVAEYLYQTGDFNRFYSALAQLVNASIMTEEEAQSYSQMVALEYDRMQMEDYENNILIQRRVPPVLEQYPVPVAIETPNMYPLPLEPTPQEAGYPVAMEAPEALYGLDPAAAPAKDVDMAFDPYELLYALWNEAYGTGDVRAEALVSELFEKVRDDSDPDDEGQVRDILLDLIANSLADDDLPPQQPLYGWQQPIADADTIPVQPMANVLAAQPIAEAEDEEAANELLAQGQKRAEEEPIANEETKPEQEAEMADGKEQPAASETQAEESQEAQEKDSDSDEPASAPIATQKRAAETV